MLPKKLDEEVAHCMAKLGVNSLTQKQSDYIGVPIEPTSQYYRYYRRRKQIMFRALSVMWLRGNATSALTPPFRRLRRLRLRTTRPTFCNRRR